MLTGCAQTPVDQACRAGLEREFTVYEENGYIRQNHRSPQFGIFLARAELDEIDGNFEGCLSNLNRALQYGDMGIPDEKEHIDSRNGLSDGGSGRQRSRPSN